MPSMIMESDTMFSHRQRPWHGLGKVVEDAPTSEDALELAGLDWHVNREPVYVNGEPLSDRVALCRDSDNQFFDIVSNNYHVLQNTDAFRVMDTIMEQSGDELKYETAGSLFGGRKVYMTCAFEKQSTVAGDSIKTYLLLSNTHNGKAALHIAITPVRVVCWNTLQTAIRAATNHWSIRHYSTMEERVAQAAFAIRNSREYMKGFCEFGERAAETKIGDGAIEALVKQLFPIDEKLGEVHKKYVQRKMDIFEKCLNAPDIKQFAGTEWGVLNAVSDFETHFARKSKQRLLANVLQGSTPLYRQTMEFLAG